MRTAEGAGGDTEGLVAKGAVGGDSENLRGDALLAFENLGAEASGAHVVGGGESSYGQKYDQRKQQFFHGAYPQSMFV